MYLQWEYISTHVEINRIQWKLLFIQCFLMLKIGNKNLNFWQNIAHFFSGPNGKCSLCAVRWAKYFTQWPGQSRAFWDIVDTQSKDLQSIFMQLFSRRGLRKDSFYFRVPPTSVFSMQGMEDFVIARKMAFYSLTYTNQCIWCIFIVLWLPPFAPPPRSGPILPNKPHFYSLYSLVLVFNGLHSVVLVRM